MNIAYKAAQFQDEKVAKKFLRRMREAFLPKVKKQIRTEVLIELAKNLDLMYLNL